MGKKIIFEKGRSPFSSQYLSKPDLDLCVPGEVFGPHMLRNDLPLPDLGELEVVRHFSELSRNSFSVDANFYPLGSCTMKYNPKLNEYVAGLPGFTDIHPYQDEADVQGALELLYDLEQLLCEITGMARFSFQPSSGAQGELTGMLMIRQFHKNNGRHKTTVIIPDSAHGTNPASASLCGYQILVVSSNQNGQLDLDQLRKVANQETAALMLTNPNTLGLFEEQILEISDIIHKAGGLLYYDGANFNPLLGITKPSLMGFDVIHLNLHKTFATPHGCGGPGAGVVGAGPALRDFLPTPLVGKKSGRFYHDYEVKNSIGRVRAFYGNFSVLVRAYCYILRLGSQGLLRVSQQAVLNANYLKEKLKKYYEVAYPQPCMHEVVFSCVKQKERGAKALDIAKRLIDYGIHPPTMYFPLIVKEALMVEPTETESKQTLDYFIETMKKINREIDHDPQLLQQAPHASSSKRVDEVKAARFPDLRWKKESNSP